MQVLSDWNAMGVPTLELNKFDKKKTGQVWHEKTGQVWQKKLEKIFVTFSISLRCKKVDERAKFECLAKLWKKQVVGAPLLSVLFVLLP